MGGPRQRGHAPISHPQNSHVSWGTQPNVRHWKITSSHRRPNKNSLHPGRCVSWARLCTEGMQGEDHGESWPDSIPGDFGAQMHQDGATALLSYYLSNLYCTSSSVSCFINLMLILLTISLCSFFFIDLAVFHRADFLIFLKFKKLEERLEKDLVLKKKKIDQKEMHSKTTMKSNFTSPFPTTRGSDRSFWPGCVTTGVLTYSWLECKQE